MSRLADLVRFELLRTELQTVADEMAIRLMRSSFSSVIRDLLDFSTAICDKQGRMLAQGFSLPLHLGAIPRAIEATLGKFPQGLDEGDLIVLNDPYQGGMHLPDIFVLSPAYYKGELIGYTVVVAHHADIGGRVPGGSGADSREIFEEGLRMPPIHLRRRGEWNQALIDVLRANVRLPDAIWGDLEAQLAACAIGSKELTAILDRHGKETYEELSQRIVDYSRTALLSVLRSWPAGTYEFTDYEDHDGINDRRVPIHVAVRIGPDGVEFDFTGTADQVEGSINCTLSFTESACYAAIRALCPEEIPVNAGFIQPIRVIAHPGTLVNARFPAGVAARGIVGFRTIDAIFGALARARPDRVPAAGDGGTTGVRFGGYRSDGTRFQCNDIISGVWGARPTADGLDGAANMAANIANRPIEIAELEDPVRFHAYEFVPDTGGAGTFRGGLALRRRIELLADSAVFSLRSHRRVTPPFGLDGGDAGHTSATFLYRDGAKELLPAKTTARLRKGDIIEHITASGGGAGPSAERDPKRIERDLEEEKITPRHAEEVYGYSAASVLKPA